MKLHHLRQALDKHPATSPRFVLPDGNYIPLHTHVTEVGHVVKNYVDCGGVTGRNEIALLQTHVGADLEHRLRSDRLHKILQLADRVLPDRDLEVEVEYDCCVVAQYPLSEVRPAGEHLDLILRRKRTQCLARERRKTEATPAGCKTEARCC